MYTLEDDHETSSRLKKRDYSAASPQSETSGDASATGDAADAAQQSPVVHGRLSPQQITGSIKALTTPGKANAGNQKVALAALTIACIGVFFTALDQTVVVTALPQIITTLQVPITQLDHAAWIVSAYLLGFIVAMPLMGRVSDIYGRRRIFLLCLAIFGIGSILCGFAPALGDMIDLSFLSVLGIDTSSPGLIWLIAARLFQAIGGGAVVPVGMAIASDFYGQERRGLALGIIGAVTEAGGALGPLYGAIIVQYFGWQWIFYLNVPVVIALGLAIWKLLPSGTRLHEGIDWIGAVLLGLALTCLSLGLAQQGTTLGPATGPAPQNNPIALALAAVFLVAFVLVERKVRWPVVDLALFKSFPFTATSLVSLFVGAALIIAMADIPIFVDTVLQLPVLDSGLALLRLTAMIPIGAVLGGWLCHRISCRFTGILGLLFTAAGFYLMSRWPIHVDWTQITISTVTAGFGFGLVISPISTTAINAVRATQAGTSSAVVTALRMVGMMLGLAALTSWALAYFKHLAAKYPSLPPSATPAQFTQWQLGYALHLVQSAHTVYSAVFFTSMVLCLLAIIPAIFLWGNKLSVAETEVADAPEPTIYDTPTIPIVNDVEALAAEAPASANAADAPVTEEPASANVAEALAAETPVTEIPASAESNAQPGVPALPAAATNRGRVSISRWWRDPKRRRLIIAITCISLVLLLVGGGVFAALALQSDDATNAGSGAAGASAPGGANSGDTGVVSGPRMIQLALDKGALTSVFASQLNLQQGALTDLNVTPLPNDGLALTLNLHIDANGIHRVMPIELDGTIGIDQQQNIQLTVQHLKRDGMDAGATAAAQMQTAVNQMLTSAVMPALRGQLKGVKFISAHTSTSIACGQGIEMFVLQIEAPPIQGIAAQPTPVPFCFKGPVDLHKLLPH